MTRVLTDTQGSRSGVAAWLAAAAMAMACGGKQMNVGDDQPMAAAGSAAVGGANGTGGRGSEPPGLTAEELEQLLWAPEGDCMPAKGSKLVGTWKGHWPAMPGELQDSDVVLTIAGLTPEGVPCGVIKIGEGAPLPPVSDPNAVYPPMLGAGGGVARDLALAQPWPGYEYRLVQVKSTPERLAFGISLKEILRPWCQQQMAYADSNSCLPPWTTSRSGTDGCVISGPGFLEMTVPCFRLDYCSSGSCFCYEGHCDALGAGGLFFELHWDGPALEGSVRNQLIFLDPITL